MAAATTTTAVNGDPTLACRGHYLIPDVLTAIFDILDLNDLLRCMKTCGRWRAVSRDHPTFSRHVNLCSLAPSHYSRFLARILHKERSGGALWLRVSLLDDSVIPRKLREMLKRVWPRIVRFSIEALDIDGAVAILGIPSPRLEVLEFWNVTQNPLPELPAAFLGGHAPVLHALTTVLVVIPSAPRLAVLDNVKKVYAGGHLVHSLKNIPLQFPRLQSLDIVDSAIICPLDQNTLRALGTIPHITLQFVSCPQWAAYLINALPLSAIRRLSILIPQGPHEGGSIQAELLHAVILNMPGDLSVVMHTALSATDPEYDFIVTSKDENGREFRRDFGMGIFLARFPIPQSICERIVRLVIHAPDWDRTCFWTHGLHRLEGLKLLFNGEAQFRDLLRPERTFRRRPVPMPFLRTTIIDVDSGAGKKLDVDFGLLHAFLRKGTTPTSVPLHEQHFLSAGLMISGEADMLLLGNTPTALRVNLVGGTSVQPPYW